MKNKLIEKIRERIAYNQIIRIAKSCQHDKVHNRHIVDLENGYLFYFPENGKITTTRNGLVFKKKEGKLICWYSRKELKELLTEIQKS